jgi:fucose permease
MAADLLEVRLSFVLPALCYAYIAFYGARGHLPVAAAATEAPLEAQG